MGRVSIYQMLISSYSRTAPATHHGVAAAAVPSSQANPAATELIKTNVLTMLKVVCEMQNPFATEKLEFIPETFNPVRMPEFSIIMATNARYCCISGVGLAYICWNSECISVRLAIIPWMDSFPPTELSRSP
jgi:hypothetical protein